MKEGLILVKLLAKYLLDQPTHFLAQMSDNPVQNLFKVFQLFLNRNYFLRYYFKLIRYL